MNNKTTNILLGILIVVLIIIAVLIGINQNRTNYQNDMMSNDDSLADNRNEVSKQIQTNSNQQVTTIQDTAKPVAKTPISQTDNPISQNLKTYTNSKYGFSFQYPSSWNQNGDLIEVKDVQGGIIDVQISFTDTISSSNLIVSYSPAPKGEQFYQSSVSDYNASQGIYTTNSKKISVAGMEALQADFTTNRDGRGNITPTRRSIIINFLDKQQTGSFKLMFSTNAPGDSEVIKFNQLLSSFKII